MDKVIPSKTCHIWDWIELSVVSPGSNTAKITSHWWQCVVYTHSTHSPPVLLVSRETGGYKMSSHHVSTTEDFQSKIQMGGLPCMKFHAGGKNQLSCRGRLGDTMHGYLLVAGSLCKYFSFHCLMLTSSWLQLLSTCLLFISPIIYRLIPG